MAHNALSRSISTVPMWIVQAVIGLCLTAGLSWATWASVTSWKHETRITVTEQQMSEVKEDVKDIKQEQKEMRNEMNAKLDRLLERRR
jgi:hypothetical protein